MSSGLVRGELLGLDARAYAQLGPGEAGSADRSPMHASPSGISGQRTSSGLGPLHEPGRGRLPRRQRLEIELALHADDRPCWQGHAARAEVHCLRAQQGRGTGYVRNRVFDEIRLAEVRLAQREPAEATATGIHAIQLAANARSCLVVNWLTGLARDLAACHPGMPDVARFRDQPRDYFRKAAPSRLGDLP